jgi:hypothetical protein
MERLGRSNHSSLIGPFMIYGPSSQSIIEWGLLLPEKRRDKRSSLLYRRVIKIGLAPGGFFEPWGRAGGANILFK